MSQMQFVLTLVFVVLGCLIFLVLINNAKG